MKTKSDIAKKEKEATQKELTAAQVLKQKQVQVYNTVLNQMAGKTFKEAMAILTKLTPQQVTAMGEYYNDLRNDVEKIGDREFSRADKTADNARADQRLNITIANDTAKVNTRQQTANFEALKTEAVSGDPETILKNLLGKQTSGEMTKRTDLVINTMMLFHTSKTNII